VALWRPAFEQDEPPSALLVLYQDAHLLVIDKPAPATVHPTARYHRHTVIKRLEAERPGEFLSLVHRLDRETSGILLVARSPTADRAFKRLLEDRSVAVAAAQAAVADADWEPAAAVRQGTAPTPQLAKTYLAITWGVPAPGIIDTPLKADPVSPLRVKMRAAARGQGLEARTAVTVLDQRAGYGLIACQLFTGRQHQIRVHLAGVGCPVVGDKLYGPDERLLARAADGDLSAEDLQRLELPRHALHAHRYVLPHAITGATLTLESPLAGDLQSFWDSLAHR
jgi:23S rRNA pseudouridine1911/1915/1917 synthase